MPALNSAEKNKSIEDILICIKPPENHHYTPKLTYEKPG